VNNNIQLMEIKHFKKIYVEITNTCNLHCSFCSPGNRPLGFMPLSVFAEVVKKIDGHTKYVYLHVKGEPLLHPQLNEILDICHENKLNVVLVTNGTLLADKGEMLLKKQALRQINISLHCFSELHHNKDRNDYIKEVIEFTKQARQQTDKMISLRFWNFEKGDQNNNPDNQMILKEIEKEFTPGSDLMNMLKPGEGLRLKERLFINSDFEFSWPTLSGSHYNAKGSCRGLRDQVAILYDGTIVPCCLDAEGIINLGDILSNDLQLIFESERAQKIFNGFINAERVEPLCRRCSFSRKR